MNKVRVTVSDTNPFSMKVDWYPVYKCENIKHVFKPYPIIIIQDFCEKTYKLYSPGNLYLYDFNPSVYIFVGYVTFVFLQIFNEYITLFKV